MRPSRKLLIGLPLGCVVCVWAMSSSLAQQPYTPPKEIPRGMSTKQPSPDKPGPSVEQLKGLPGAPDPDTSIKNDPSSDYPDGLKLSDSANGKLAEDNKGSLPPAEFPVAAQRLELKFERPLEYAVRGTHRLAIKDREDLKQVYRSAVRVRYEKIADLARRPEANWRVSQDDGDALAKNKDLVPMLLTVEKSTGQYTYPELLAEPERVHQLTRAAQLSYLITPRGKIEDVQVHEPTSALSKNSIEHFAHMLSLSQPVFPERPVSPGDTWQQKILYRDGDGLAQLSEDSTNTFVFERWRSCRRGVCALISFKQDLRAAGRLTAGEHETQGTSVGEGEGWILFDYETGEVVKSYLKLKGLGTVRALGKSKDGSLEEQASARVVTEYEVTSERIDAEQAVIPTVSKTTP